MAVINTTVCLTSYSSGGLHPLIMMECQSLLSNIENRFNLKQRINYRYMFM